MVLKILSLRCIFKIPIKSILQITVYRGLEATFTGYVTLWGLDYHEATELWYADDIK